MSWDSDSGVNYTLIRVAIFALALPIDGLVVFNDWVLT
jgi:hypothetical protein